MTMPYAPVMPSPIAGGLPALATHTETFQKFIANVHGQGLTSALTERDTPFGDYRTREITSSE